MTLLASPPVAAVEVTAGWSIRTVCTATGYLRTRREAEGISVVLGDCVRPRPGQAQQHGHDAAACTTVWFGPDGEVAVSCLAAPPALWVGRRGTRLVPGLPSSREQLDLEPGDLLVVCSADALEHLDHGLPHLVRFSAGLCAPSERAHAVASDLGVAARAGAAVVAVWAPSGAPRTAYSSSTEEDRR